VPRHAPALNRLYGSLLASVLLVSSSFAQSSRSGLGSIPYPGGATFRVWAPNAASVAVGGEFNDWHAAPMVREDPAARQPPLPPADTP
jgi:1,4-alpha-glucan branching enzyme